MPSHRSWLGACCAIAVLTIWSSFILIGRMNATGAHTLLPLDIAFLRFVFSGLGVLLIAAIRARRAGPSMPRRTAALGPLSLAQIALLGGSAGVAYCSLAYTGFFFAPAAHASVFLTGSLPLWTTLIAFFALHERLTMGRSLALLLVIAGNVLMGESSFRTSAAGVVWKGDVCFAAASIMWATFTVSCRKWRVAPLDGTVAIGVFCLLTFVPVYALGASAGWWQSHLARAGWREIAFQVTFQAGFAMLIAGPAFTQVIVSYGAVRAAMLTALVPVLSALAAIPILHEDLGVLPLAGLIAVIAGFLVAVFTARPMADSRSLHADVNGPVRRPTTGGHR